MDPQQILPQYGGWFLLLLAAALLSLTWEWIANSQREAICKDCPECKRRRLANAEQKRRDWAKRNRLCPHESARLGPDGVCPLCQTKWW